MTATPFSTGTIDQITASVHEHSWAVRSRHQTSDGLILYVFCSQCSAMRVDLLCNSSVMPTALSRTTAAPEP